MSLERDNTGRWKKPENTPNPLPTTQPDEIKPAALDAFSKELVNETAPIVAAPKISATPNPAPETKTETVPTPVAKPSGSSNGFGSILAGAALALVAGAAVLVLGKRTAPAEVVITNAPVQMPSAKKRFL